MELSIEKALIEQFFADLCEAIVLSIKVTSTSENGSLLSQSEVRNSKRVRFKIYCKLAGSVNQVHRFAIQSSFVSNFPSGLDPFGPVVLSGPSVPVVLRYPKCLNCPHCQHYPKLQKQEEEKLNIYLRVLFVCFFFYCFVMDLECDPEKAAIINNHSMM